MYLCDHYVFGLVEVNIHYLVRSARYVLSVDGVDVGHFETWREAHEQLDEIYEYHKDDVLWK